MRTIVSITLALAAAAPLLSGCGQLSPARAAHVATGLVSHQLCSATFVAGLDPDAYFREALAPIVGPVRPLLSHTIDRERGEVTARFVGLAESRAVFRGPLGCVLAQDRAPVPTALAATPATPSLLPPIAGAALVEPRDPALARALAHAFEETDAPPHRRTKAIVVVHAGRIVAERYASGYGVDTPLHGWSMTKSVTNALVGILVREGKLRLDGPAPIAAWADPADPRHAITIDHLLRMTSGLDIGQSLTASAGDAFDPSAQMVYIEPDTAAYAQRARLRAAPGTQWLYTNGNTQLLSSIVRDAVGGDAAAVLAFARRELFGPLGMERVTLEFDAAGTPIGASHLWAPARAWARFGMLYLHDGVVGGQPILPAGWVDYSARYTPGSDAYGYAAGFWTNRGASPGARVRTSAGMPEDSFMARGSDGQYVIVVPSFDLVIARLGYARTPRGDIAAVSRLVAEVVAALRAPG
jgi:CubicO group peptidase (beta-lactamase class C family)